MDFWGLENAAFVSQSFARSSGLLHGLWRANGFLVFGMRRMRGTFLRPHGGLLQGHKAGGSLSRAKLALTGSLRLMSSLVSNQTAVTRRQRSESGFAAGKEVLAECRSGA